jgi:hypothetical protein
MAAGQRGFGGELDLGRDAGGGAAVRVVSPAAWDVELAVDHRVPGPARALKVR